MFNEVIHVNLELLRVILIRGIVVVYGTIASFKYHCWSDEGRLYENKNLLLM